MIAGIGVASAGLRPSLVLVSVAAFVLMSVIPIGNTASQVLWQTKVPTAVQGRVFAIRRMIAQAISPIAILLAGPLADRVFEPLLADGGGLASSVGSIIGTGSGRGVAFMFVINGVTMVAAGVIGFLMPRVRNLETELPDQTTS
jgi:hypothetical protein